MCPGWYHFLQSLASRPWTPAQHPGPAPCWQASCTAHWLPGHLTASGLSVSLLHSPLGASPCFLLELIPAPVVNYSRLLPGDSHHIVFTLLIYVPGLPHLPQTTSVMGECFGVARAQNQARRHHEWAKSMAPESDPSRSKS